jgi:hypothetical protein
LEIKEKKMMKHILGNLIILLLLTLNLYGAGVTLRVDTPAIYKGDRATFTLVAEGDDVNFPVIDTIKGYRISATSSSQSVRIINGDTTKSISKSYTFSPQQSLEIGPFDVEIDGQTYQSNQETISVIKPTASQNGADFVLEMKSNKDSVAVGESIKLDLIIKQKLGTTASKFQLGEPEIENFWVKKVNATQKGSEGEYVTQTISYLLFPQKAGDFTLPAIELDVGNIVQRRARGVFNDPFFNDPFFSNMGAQLQWKKVFSNTLNIHVKPLPEGLELYGNYKISLNVDTTKVKANKPVNVTVTINGEGNIDDIKKFTLDIDDAIVYADEPKITSHLTGDTYGGTFTQKIAVIADKNYTIAPLSLTYYDKRTQSKKTIATPPVDITVTGTPAQQAEVPHIQSAAGDVTATMNEAKRETKSVHESRNIKYLFLLFGIFIGSFATYLFYRYKDNTKHHELAISKAIKQAKTDRALFDVLLPWAKEDPLISDVLQKLEDNIYNRAHHNIDKDALLDFFELQEEHKREEAV